LVCRNLHTLRTATPVAVYSEGLTQSRRRLNIHRQCPKIGMQKPAYLSAHILYAQAHPQVLPLRLQLGASHSGEALHRDEWTDRGRAWGCHTHIFSVLSGGSLNPPPRLLVEDNGASHPLRESRGGLGMVLPPAKHAGFPGRKGRPRSSRSERKSPKQKAPGSATARLSLYPTSGHVWNARLVHHRGNTLKSSRSTTGDFCHTVCSQTTLLSNRHTTLRFLSDYLSLAGGQGSVV